MIKMLSILYFIEFSLVSMVMILILHMQLVVIFHEEVYRNYCREHTTKVWLTMKSGESCITQRMYESKLAKSCHIPCTENVFAIWGIFHAVENLQ